MSLFRWFFRGWFVFIPLSLMVLHFYAVRYSLFNICEFNKIISFTLEIFGGGIILYTIDSNIGIMRNSSFFSMFFGWLRSFPLINKSMVVETRSGELKITGFPPKIRRGGPGKTTEDHIEYLQKQIGWLKEDLNDEVNKLKKTIYDIEKRINKDIGEINQSLAVVNTKIIEISTGDFEWQIFGVLLIVHGASVSFFA